MKTAFFVIAALMVALALALLLLPLLRHGKQAASRRVFVLAMGVAFALPIATLGLYVLVGSPTTLNGVPRPDAQMNIDAAVAQLKTHLIQQPDDAQGWLLLAQTDSVLKRTTDARDAFDQVLKLDASNATAMVGWAEADSILRDDHLIQGRSLDLLQQAVQIDPQNQKGLWLLGISQYQHELYADAASTWRKLLPLLDAGSSVAKTVTEQIAAADAHVGTAAPTNTTSAKVH